MHPTDFHTEVLPLKGKMYRFAKSLLRQGAEAEDVVQEVLIQMWQHWSKLRAVDNLEAWAMRATRNRAIDHLRSRHRRTEDLDRAAHLSNGQPGPDEMAAVRDALARVRHQMASLPEQQRLVMHLRDIEQYSYQEIAAVLDLTMAQVKINLFRARQKVRASLKKRQGFETP